MSGDNTVLDALEQVAFNLLEGDCMRDKLEEALPIYKAEQAVVEAAIAFREGTRFGDTYNAGELIEAIDNLKRIRNGR